MQFFISHLASWLRTRRFSLRSHKSLAKHSVSRLSYLFAQLHLLSSDSFSSTLLSANLSLLSDPFHLCFSSVHIVGSLTSKLPSTIITLHYNYNYTTFTLQYTRPTLHYTTLQYTSLRHTTLDYTNYTTPQLQLQLQLHLHYTNYTTALITTATATAPTTATTLVGPLQDTLIGHSSKALLRDALLLHFFLSQVSKVLQRIFQLWSVIPCHTK